jgi:UDP-glucose-4-epimerase GalE
MSVVLVTGGAGYVGSHACKALAAAGFMPVTIDNLERGFQSAVRWGPLVKADLLDRGALIETMTTFKPVAVLHFAAHAYVGESVEKPLLYYQNNVAGTLSLLGAMAEAGITRMVFSSTCATYGVPNSLPLTEDHSQQPVNPYGASKLMVERIVTDACASNGLRAVMLRYFNAAGADPDGEIGENHDPETHLIPLVLDAILGRVSTLWINGMNHGTRDGTCVRDYVHVSDLADAHVMALDYLFEGGDTVAMNLGTGTGYSVKQVIETAERVTGRSVPLRYGPPRAGDPPILVADASRALKTIKWLPKRSSLDVQIADAWNWRLSMGG